MEKRRLGRLAWSVVTLAASSAFGQVVLSNSESTISGSTNEIGGKVAYELLTVSDERPTLILRYGQLKSGSEIIVLDGRTLARDREYSMDYVSGVVYLKVAGKSASVQYRYDEAKGTTGTFGIGSSGTKFQGYTFQLNRNAAMVLGMGLTERLANGTVLSSNVYGLNNSFSFGRGKSTGVFLVSDRKQVKSTNLFGDKNGTPNSDLEGKSEAIIQQAELSSFGGKWLAYYQSIGEKFGGLSALEGAGFAQDKIQQFSSERGLKRTEFQAQNIGGKGLALGAGLKSIGDETGSIVWRNSTVNLFGAHIDFSVFKVDPGFSKFNNIAETDRQQLSKERGMERRSFNASKSFKGSKWAFESSNVETVDGPGIYRRKFEFSSSKVSTSFSDQHVVKGFNRFGDLREADRDQLARESGLVRQAASLQLTPSKNQSLNAGSSTIRTDTGDFAATSIDIKAGKVSLSHSRVDIGQGFSNLGSMRPDEINGHVSSMLKMTDPGANPQGQDAGGWGNQAGLNRSMFSFGFDFGKATALAFRSNSIQGAVDQIEQRVFSFVSPKVGLTYKEQHTGASFTESGKLLLSEQQRLGTSIGFNKSDLSFKSEDKGKTLRFDRMSAQDQGGSAGRQLVSYASRGFNFNYNRRFVDLTFGSMATMVDPERDMLASIAGYDQAEFNGNWQILKNLGFTFQDSKALNRSSGQGRFGSSMAFLFNLDNKTKIMGSSTEFKQTDPLNPLVDQQSDSLSIARNLGKIGNVTFTTEKSTFDGSQDKNPDLSRDTVSYDNQITKSTSFRTEHSMTRYENGEHETRVTNSVSQALSPRIGVSVTDTKVERPGNQPDETHRDYGFWVDFGRNIRLNYKAQRNLKGETEGDRHDEVNVTPGQVQGVNLGGGYTRNSWDHRRDQHAGNVNFSNVKPFQWGWFRDVKFNYSADTARDMDQWQRENRAMGLGARIGAFGFAWDYKSQSLPFGDRAIDRIFSFTTDTTGKGRLRADVSYNVRTLPMGNQATTRDYQITALPSKSWEIVHSLKTNPLQSDGNALLGAIATPNRLNKWNVNYLGNKRTNFGLAYEEFFNEQTNQQTSVLKLGLKLFADNPSPLDLEFITAESNTTGVMHRSHGFKLGFVQRPGPNQSLSFSFSNLNWELARPEDQSINNWNFRLDFSWRR